MEKPNVKQTFNEYCTTHSCSQCRYQGYEDCMLEYVYDLGHIAGQLEAFEQIKQKIDKFGSLHAEVTK